MHTRQTVLSSITDGQIFGVEYLTRGSNYTELRTTTGRMGVKKGLKGGVKRFSDEDKDLITYFDLPANGRRSFGVEAVQSMTVNGERYDFTD